MTRINPGPLYPLDPEIDRTFHNLLRTQQLIGQLPDNTSITDSDFIPYSLFVSDSSSYSFDSISVFDFDMAQPPPRERTLRELAAPDFTYESLCIQYPDEDVPYVLKTGLIHLLPKFHGHAGEDPHKHLKEFYIVCSTMKPPDVQEDHIYLKAFPHSLEGVAKD